MSSKLSKMMIALLGAAYIFAMGSSYATAAALPAVGDSKRTVELQYGPAYAVQKNLQMSAKAYGYPFSADGLDATLWIEYDNKDCVKKEMLLLNDSVKIRHFGQYFPELYAAVAAKDSVTAVIRSYPRDQLAVRISADALSERWIRFIFAGNDKTCINMHSKIKGFEVIETSPGTIRELMKPGKALGCQFNGAADEYPPDGTWQRTDNYFLPQLHFSERLIPRQGTDLIVIHHAAMPDDTSRADIHELHLTNQWAGIGYHKLVFASGEVENGRPEQTVGAHAFGANRRSLGIVLVGDFNKTRPAQVQLEAAARLTLELMKKYQIPLKNVRPHRAVTEGTDCPGLLFPWQEFIQMIAAGLK